jgi:hypothetical protein
MGTNLNQLDKDLNACDADVKAVRGDIALVRSDIVSARADMAILRADLVGVETAIQSLAIIGELETKMQALSDKIDQLIGGPTPDSVEIVVGDISERTL